MFSSEVIKAMCVIFYFTSLKKRVVKCHVNWLCAALLKSLKEIDVKYTKTI